MLDELKATVKADLFVFAKWVLGYERLDADIHGPICRMLEDVARKRLLICIPRGWYKTTLVSIAFPIWCAVNDPNIHILLVQNTITNAQSKLQAIDSTFKKNALFKSLFPELLPDKSCKWTQVSMEVKRTKPAVEATFEAAGIRTTLTSRHYDLIIEDDTVSPDLDQMTIGMVMPSKDDINQAIGFHENCSPLLEHVMRSRWVVVGTRWYEHDLISHIKQNQSSFECYQRAAIEVIDGELKPSFPKEFPEEVLKRYEEDLGPYMYACLYRNNPTRSSDMIFQKEWFRYWDELPDCEHLNFYTTVDPAGDPDLSKRKNGRKKTDWNVVITTGHDRRTGKIYVAEISKKKCNPGGLMDMLFEHVIKWRPLKVGIESVAYQQSLDYWCKQEMENRQVFFSIELLTHKNMAKNLRIQSLQPQLKAGTLLLHRSMLSLQTELENFPLSAHDDESDCLAMHRELWPVRLHDRPIRPLTKEVDTVDLIKEIRDRHKSDPATDPHAEFFTKGGYEYQFN